MLNLFESALIVPGDIWNFENENPLFWQNIFVDYWENWNILNALTFSQEILLT